MSRPSKREAATAHHEAGHAVVGLWEGVGTRLRGASIVRSPDGATLGHNSLRSFPRVRDVERGDDGKPRHFYRDFSPEFDDRRLLERRLRPDIILRYAGVLAEKKYTGRRHNWAGASHDLETAGMAIDYVTGSERQAQKYSAYLWVVAEDAVDMHWPEIQELAQELLVRKTMTGREVKAFIRAGTAAERLESERIMQMALTATNRANPSGPEPPESMPGSAANARRD